jgi:transposase
MVTPDRKVRKLMYEYQRTGKVSTASLRADLDPKTGRKYIKSGRLPSDMNKEHTWRTREDPFDDHWSECAAIFCAAPELNAKTVFDWLCEQYPDAYSEGQLRTFQRKVRVWRAQKGPEKEVYFPQEHKPGRRMSTDFTHMDKLNITIAGEQFDHMLCHCVLTYSNWSWATICHSESMLALRIGIQGALFRLGRTPKEHWTDHSSAATHQPPRNAKQTKREFNTEYLSLMEHFSMKPRTIQVNKPNENGDVESLNGVLKRRVEQYLLLRGSRDFTDVDQYRIFLEDVLEKSNKTRTKRIAEEMEHMRVLNVSRLTEYNEYTCLVRNSSTVTVDRRIYSVPSRLIGEKVRIRRYENHIEVVYKGVVQLEAPWIGRDGTRHHINYRHIISWLVRKSGAFRNYRYHADLFPTEAFRWAYDSLSEALNERNADREYLQILSHASKNMECEVNSALINIRACQCIPRLESVVAKTRRILPVPPEMDSFEISLAEYDQLLQNQGGAAA